MYRSIRSKRTFLSVDTVSFLEVGSCLAAPTPSQSPTFVCAVLDRSPAGLCLQRLLAPSTVNKWQGLVQLLLRTGACCAQESVFGGVLG